jgi:hypothetical protein
LRLLLKMLLPPELLSLLILSPAFSLAAPVDDKKESIWQVNIFRGPAPPPGSEFSPPLSDGALRDKSKLKYEIIGIAGAYVVWVSITLCLILFVGLKLRRKAQSSNRTLSMEMLKSARVDEKRLPPSPGPLSPGKMASLKSWATGGRHKKNPSNVTSSTIDTRLVEDDKHRNMEEMVNLYAHVMAHEEQRDSVKANSSTGSSPSSPEARHGFQHRMPTPPRSPGREEIYPAELQHLRQPPNPSESPYYYPPPQQQEAGEDISRATTRLGETPKSFSSRHHRTGSSNSNKVRPGRISVRGKPISEPIGDADLSQSFGDTESTPLSPRLYTPGPAPPTPGRHVAQGLPMSPRLYNPGPPPPIPTEQEAHGMYRRKQTPGAISIGGSTATNASTNSLPFRQFQDTLRSAPPTKTTFVNVRESGLMRHPKTGVPQTPYSPYMPMTPMTPVTPSRLMTKKDMKREKKLQGMKVVNEDDMVKSDEDMWGA